MAVFKDMRLTDAGRNLLAEAIATGSAFIIDSVVVGDGWMPDDATREAMTAIVSPKAKATILSRQNEPNGIVTIRASINSADITSDFFIRELGVMARIADGGPILYGYDNAGDMPGSIPADDGSGFVTHVFDIRLIIGNATNVSFTVGNPGEGTASLEAHNMDEHAHPNLIIDGGRVM